MSNELRRELLAELGRIHSEWSQEVTEAAAENPVDVSRYLDGGMHYADVAATWEQEAGFQRRTAHIQAELRAMESAGPSRAPDPTNRAGELESEDQPSPVIYRREPDPNNHHYSPSVDEVEFNRTRLVDGVRFFLAPTGKVALALLKEVRAEGRLYFRDGKKWVPLPHGLRVMIDQFPLIEVTQDATAAWDERDGFSYVFLLELQSFRLTRGFSW
ncbi:hypothetical protein J2W20_002351 [Sinomonas atrocyanea]|uniref:hypothetical protein n=1 Tax=Sinomonas atrocyanea TaxID=37927 RepID=UPI00277F6BE0|nr:hypothetical protein [Sinomonas atrocyanea]MDQ0260447.1 hypothetical protein [Sinomonas atrocyanea]